MKYILILVLQYFVCVHLPPLQNVTFKVTLIRNVISKTKTFISHFLQMKNSRFNLWQNHLDQTGLRLRPRTQASGTRRRRRRRAAILKSRCWADSLWQIEFRDCWENVARSKWQWLRPLTQRTLPFYFICTSVTLQWYFRGTSVMQTFKLKCSILATKSRQEPKLR